MSARQSSPPASPPPSADVGTIARLSAGQWVVLVYLGAIASGIGFFLFNAGARQVDVGALAIFNNIKVPLAILASVLLFGEGVDWPRLIAGGIVIAGGAWAQRMGCPPTPADAGLSFAHHRSS